MRPEKQREEQGKTQGDIDKIGLGQALGLLKKGN